MHQIIYALVDAESEEDALEQANLTFDRLVGARLDERPVFDYYVTFDDEDAAVAGKARWGERPVAARVDSHDGARMLKRGWDATVSEFERNLEKVEEALEEMTVEEMMHDTNLVRHACHHIGAFRGPSLFLYDGHANGIRNRSHLDRVLDSSESLWIVPADVHY
ncbi:hypothetical protein [Haloarchaeobius litoreus]|uniref:DUF7995 domain-containing protein n=1 Tax=Haloarchaeobius litoreus TaxID=755306 RepID=A0ABD6DPM4_9EURY|nr:hypothetical protein [Haloarchaeobius litoreus]